MPATPSSRLSLHAPSGGDPADVPSDVTRLRDQLDDVVLGYDQGPLAARPAAGVEGRQYYATDDGSLYYDFGSGWIPYAWQPGMFAFSAVVGAPPFGWLKADGQEVRQAAYPALFRALSFLYSGGVAPRPDWFKIPDLRGRTIVGEDQTGIRLPEHRYVSNTSGSVTHTLTQAELPASNVVDTGTSTQRGSPWFVYYATNTGPVAPNNVAVGPWGPYQGMGFAHNNMQPYMALNAWVKY